MSTAATLHSTPPQHHRFHLLDGLRGVAALFIVPWHMPLSLGLSSLDSNGLLAVDFFFCLSGFVIAFSYEKRLAEALSLKDFFVARMIRLYPIYLLGTTLGFVVAIVHGLGHTLGMWFTLSVLGLAMLPTSLLHITTAANFPFDIPAWSLFYEVVANIAFALLIKFRAARSPFLAAISLLSLAYIGASLHRGHGVNMGYSLSTFDLGFARVGFSFFAGVLVQRLYRARVRHLAASGSRLFAAIAITICLAFILCSPLTFMHSDHFRFTTIIFLFPVLVYHGAFTKLPQRLTGFCIALGDISYPLYLLHRPLISPLYTPAFENLRSLHPFAMQMAVLPFILALAFIARWVGRYFDAPLRKHLTRRYNAARNPLPSTSLAAHL